MIDQSLPQLLNNTDTERLSGYAKNLKYYAGEIPQAQGQLIRGARPVSFNYVKAFIDKATSYLMGNMSFTINEAANPEAAARAEAALRQVYLYNNLDMLDMDTETDCAILGDACYKVIWDAAGKRVRITAPDAQGLWAWTRGDDINEISRVITRYTLQPDALLKLHGYQAETEAQVIEDWTEESFTLWIAGQQVRSLPNPYPFIPYVIFPNIRQPKSLWGVSDIVPIINAQVELNRAFTQLSHILELSGNPIAVLENVDKAEDIAVNPGAVWTLPEDAKAYLLDLLQGGGVKLHIDYIDQVYRALHDLSETPRAAFGGMTADLSGVAMAIELYSLTQKVKRKRLIRTAAYRKRNTMILTLLNMFTGLGIDGLEPAVIWGSVLPQDLATEARAQQLLTIAGMRSRRTSMSELGTLDPDKEWQLWLQEETAIKQITLAASLIPTQPPQGDVTTPDTPKLETSVTSPSPIQHSSFREKDSANLASSPLQPLRGEGTPGPG